MVGLVGWVVVGGTEVPLSKFTQRNCRALEKAKLEPCPFCSAYLHPTTPVRRSQAQSSKPSQVSTFYSPNFLGQSVHCDHKPRAACVCVCLLFHWRSADDWAEWKIYAALVTNTASQRTLGRRCLRQRRHHHSHRRISRCHSRLRRHCHCRCHCHHRRRRRHRRRHPFILLFPHAVTSAADNASEQTRYRCESRGTCK